MSRTSPPLGTDHRDTCATGTRGRAQAWWRAARRSGVIALLPALLTAQATDTKDAGEALVLGEIPSVFGASRFDQAVTEAPASVSVVTAEDIRTYGWRTLADVLRSVRGFYVTNDRAYSFVGTRGFGRPGDYNARILLLIDGSPVNENIFGAAYVGLESMVDLTAVDRVEVIRGPASSVYGANAFFAVINVVTHRGRASGGTRATVELGSFGSRELALSGGGRARNGIEFFGSAGLRRIAGQDFHFAEFDSAGGMAVGRDGERRERLFGKVGWGRFTLEGIVNRREKLVPTASFDTDFNRGRLEFGDRQSSLALHYAPSGDDRASVSGSLALNRYDYDGVYPYGTEALVEWSHGTWAIAEAQYSRRLRTRDRLLVGGEVTGHMRQEQGATYDATQAPEFLDNTTASTIGVFSVAEVHLTPRLILNGGLRFDHSRWLRGNLSPRAALIYTIGAGSDVKLLVGSAYRAPTNYERFYNDGEITSKANIALQPERITTTELLFEHVFSSHLKWTSSLYNYHARRLIDAAEDPRDGLLQYGNIGSVRGQGLELELELEFGGMNGRASYTLQRASSTSDWAAISNSPRHLATANAWLPLLHDRARLGVELRAMSARLSPRGVVVPGHTVANLVASSRRIVRGVDATLGVFNLFDAAFGDPVGEEHRQAFIMQDGRTLRLALGVAF